MGLGNSKARPREDGQMARFHVRTILALMIIGVTASQETGERHVTRRDASQGVWGGELELAST